jgi:hypothetical protein
MRPFPARAIGCLMALLLSPGGASAWGVAAQRLIAARAIETLPPEIRGFYEASASEIRAQAASPTLALEKDPEEKKYHVLYLDRYSPFPFDALPREYREALTKYGQTKLNSNGRLPWQVGVYSEKLTIAFRNHEWNNVRQFSAQLANYVAETFDPLNMSDPRDPRSGTRPGLQARFSTSLVDRYSLFLPLRPNDAYFIKDPTDNAFEDCIGAHSWLEVVENADRRARAQLTDFSNEYYDRLYNLVGAVLIRQLSDAATEVGSFWLTAWTNAGRPSLPQ